jgi:hypothetical protein
VTLAVTLGIAGVPENPGTAYYWLLLTMVAFAALHGVKDYNYDACC